jgi:glycosyltransferase involved in cell wall biosynthesis
MVLEDKCPANFAEFAAHQPERFALFVGGTFYANRAGIEWFVREVVPQIELPIYIVGRGFEALKEELEIPGKVVVVGAVDSLADWYRQAFFVIAPIFSGSGMKTKVAEALMYGKKVIGTPEAFSGYDEIVDCVGRVCTNKEEFVTAIRHADEMVREPFDAELRSIYEKRYSFAAATARFKAILSA